MTCPGGKWKRGIEGAKQLLRLHPRPDAIFAVNDLVAIGAMKFLQEAGLKFPATLVASMGVGNVRYGDCLSVPLSTVDLHAKEVGTTAAEHAFLSCLAGQKLAPEPIFLEPRLIIRESSRRGAKGSSVTPEAAELASSQNPDRPT